MSEKPLLDVNETFYPNLNLKYGVWILTIYFKEVDFAGW